ncbi:VOC family protein [Nonomuraea spiralis]|uniref:VOC family protein n=1 Tax=Nonomuraea spiralis TaxID=46182 RepID=A0ABV5I777_9ACTN|nr:VOC family protein [Nonomuraea spiralis]GGT10612.1 glyoxalase [Nonomuraea spiralis]
MDGIAEFRTTVLDCPEPRALAEFYSRLLGWPVTYEDEEWVVVEDGGSPKRLAFQRAPDHRPPSWPDPARPQQLHIDVTVTDLDRAEKQVQEIGATKHEHQPSEDDSFRVFLDPAGHPFCLCRD